MNLLGYLMESRGPANAIRRLASIGTRFGVSQRGMATALDAYLDVTDEFHCTPTLAVTAIGGNRELITDGVNGLLVPTRAPEELAKGILLVLTDEPPPDPWARRSGGGSRAASLWGRWFMSMRSCTWSFGARRLREDPGPAFIFRPWDTMRHGGRSHDSMDKRGPT